MVIAFYEWLLVRFFGCKGLGSKSQSITKKKLSNEGSANLGEKVIAITFSRV